MNERQPYEQLIADKLQQLPVPDINKSWQQMKRLLDDSQSPGGGGGGKRSPGGGRWWGAGIIAVVLITGVWVFIESRSSSQKELASAKHPATREAAAANKDAPAKSDASAVTQFNHPSTNNAPDQTSTQTNTTPASTGNTGNIPPGGAGNNNSNNPGSAAPETPAPAPAGSLPVTADNNKPGADYSKSLPANEKSKDKDKTASSRRRRNVPLPAPPGNRETTAVAHNNPKTPGRTINKTNNHTPAHRPGHHNTDVAKNHATNPSGTKAISPGARNNRPATGNSMNPADEQRLAKQRERREHLEELIQPTPPGQVNSSLAAGDHINPRKDTSHLLNDKTKALIAKSRQPDTDAAAAKKAKKSSHLNLDIKPFSLKTDTDAWWGAGLSLNAALPVGGQNRYKYNVNGGTGLLTDYLPSPYVEFHLNSYVYLQTEINLSAPQYLPQVCLFQKMGMPYSGGGPSFTQRDQSIYIQKLYYFSWPVSLHYSPVNNLYLTTGLQFSSFQSGLALINERRFNPGGSMPDSYSSKLVKFKDDSIAAQLRPNEWRWQLGAEYYWNRFTLGMRYNKAFTDLVSIGPGLGIPEAKVRNSALLFFVRFNFFEGRKKDNLSKASNSLVRY